MGDLWFCLSLDEKRHAEPNPCYSHIAFSIHENDFDSMRSCLEKAAIVFWKDNKSQGDSLYILDPDGHKLEIHVGHWEARMNHFKQHPKKGMVFYTYI